MSHRMDGWVTSGFQRMDWDRAAELCRRALAWFLLAGTAFLLCRAQLPTLLAPLGMAFIAAALTAGKQVSALLAGCLAAALGGGLSDFNLRLPVGVAIVLGGGIAWDSLTPMLRRALEWGRWQALGRRLARLAGPTPTGQARAPTPGTQAACSALAGLGVLVPGLAGLGDALWPGAVSVAAASVAAVAAAPFFCAALEVRPGRRWLTAEERTGVFLLGGFMLLGLARLSAPVALCVGAALVQLLDPAGALAGAGAGVALLAAGADAGTLVLTTVGGAAAQLCPGLSRPARAACACGAMLCVGLLMNVEPWCLLGAGASSLLVALMPEAWALALARLAGPTPNPCDPRRLAVRLQRDTAARLRALGAAFGDLAEGYNAPTTIPDARELVHQLRNRLCQGCGGARGCWQDGDGGVRLLCDLVARAVSLSGETPLFEGEATPELCRRCRRGRMIPERIGDMLEDYARARRDGLRRGSENRLISAQFDQARQLILGVAGRQARPLRIRDRQAARAAAALERAGIATDSVIALGGRGVEIIAALSRGSWTPAQARLASARLTETFGRRYAPAGPLGHELRFVRRPRLRARMGVACAPRVTGMPCGDSHLACMLDDERLLVLICDGMGSGEEARQESAVAVRLLGRFLRAGASCDLAIETVNALLLNRGSEDMFATVDMLIMNLSTGEAEFVKQAACPTLILRAGQVRRVEGGAPAPGHTGEGAARRPAGSTDAR